MVELLNSNNIEDVILGLRSENGDFLLVSNTIMYMFNGFDIRRKEYESYYKFAKILDFR